jgi:hypothetical protein
VTTIYVTHDQIEAMTLADRVVVMSRAEIQQIGTPEVIYNQPANLFVAGFIGSPSMNLIAGALRDGVFEAPGVSVPGFGTLSLPDVVLGVRAEDMAVTAPEQAQIRAEVFSFELTGDSTLVMVRIGEQVVEHRARKFGTSKFGMERFLNGFLDLLTISFMSRFARKPMHLFGALGLSMFFLSAVGVGALVVNKGISMAAGDPGRNITEISTFYISLTGMVLGGLFFATGFLAEMVSRMDVRRTAYLVSASLGSTVVSDE